MDCTSLSLTSEPDVFGQELREIHVTWLDQEKEKEQETGGAENEGHTKEEGVENPVVAEVSAEVETPIAFVFRDLPMIDTASLHATKCSSEAFANTRATAISSPTSSISTVSDLTSTELCEESESSEEQMATPGRHDTFYFEDGNVEIVCGDTVFRVHSTVVSFSSSKLRDMLSPMTLLNAPAVPKGCPRVVFNDSPKDFAVLLKMIYTPGCVLPSLSMGSTN